MKNILLILFFISTFQTNLFSRDTDIIVQASKQRTKSIQDTLNSEECCKEYPLISKTHEGIKDKNSWIDFFKTIFPVFTLLVGIAINKFIDWLNDRKKIIKAGKRWAAELICMKSPIDSQIEYINKFLTEHRENVYKIPDMSIIPLLNCESFNSLDKSELLEYFEKIKKLSYVDASKRANRVNMFTTILKMHYSSLNTKFEESLLALGSLTGMLNDKLQILLSLFGDYGVEIERSTSKDPLENEDYKKLFVHFRMVIENQELLNDVFVLNDRFFKPVLAELAAQRLNQSLNPIRNIIKDCIEPIKKIEMEKYYLNLNLSSIVGYLNLDKSDLESVLKEFE